MDLNNVTVTGNTGGPDTDGTVQLRNTILVGNELSDCRGPGALASQGYNLLGNLTDCAYTAGPGDQLGTDPRLAPLSDAGSPTPTYALCTAPGEPDPICPGASPALDAGNPAAPGSALACEAADQRGVGRPRDGNGDGTAVCDIGAYEAPGMDGPLPPPPPAALAIGLSTNGSAFQPGQTLVVSVDVANPGLPMSADVYFGVLLPDGTTLVCVAEAGRRFAVGTVAEATSLPAMVAGMSLAAPFTASGAAVLVHTLSGAEPPGRYVFFLAFARPGGLHASNLLALATADVTVTATPP